MSCSHEYVKPRLHRWLTVLACASALLSTSLHAANDRDRNESDGRTTQKSERVKDKPTRFETCKREARGKDGPERASFMTECLKDHPPASR